jgi:antimicrobial peptide system SdpB family protein
MLIVIKRIESVAFDLSKKMVWSNVYGFARTLLAIGTLLTLLFNDNITLFGIQEKNTFQSIPDLGLTQFGLFYLLRFNLVLAKSIAIIILIIVASGWRPQITCIFHWFIAFSFNLFTAVPDGGDQLTNVLTLLLIPICIFDSRKWHWSESFQGKNPYINLIAYSTYWIIRLQVAVVYLDAATEKFKVDEWRNGTILWYLFNDPVMGCNDFFRQILIPILKNPFFLTMFTWSVIILELVLFLGLTIDKKYRKRLLLIGLSFHFFIILIHGLISFFFAMAAALILYLHPWDEPFKFLNKIKINRRFKAKQTNLSKTTFSEKKQIQLTK